MIEIRDVLIFVSGLVIGFILDKIINKRKNREVNKGENIQLPTTTPNVPQEFLDEQNRFKELNKMEEK